MTDLKTQRRELVNKYMAGEIPEDEFTAQMKDLDAEMLLLGTGTTHDVEKMYKKARQKFREHRTKKNNYHNMQREMEMWEHTLEVSKRKEK